MIINDFDIEQIAESGECFRWNKIGNKHYSGIIGQDYCEVWQEGNKVEFIGVSEEKFKYYFDLERDYSKIKEHFSDDAILKEAIGFGEGIRILNQDKFELKHLLLHLQPFHKVSLHFLHKLALQP